MEKENTTGVNVVKGILTVLDGSFLTRENMLRNVPFILFLFGLGILYIANSHYAERCVIMTNRTEKELKELRSEFITNRSDLMTALKQSEMAKAVEPMGIVESRVPAKKILVNEPDKLH